VPFKKHGGLDHVYAGCINNQGEAGCYEVIAGIGSKLKFHNNQNQEYDKQGHGKIPQPAQVLVMPEKNGSFIFQEGIDNDDHSFNEIDQQIQYGDFGKIISEMKRIRVKAGIHLFQGDFRKIGMCIFIQFKTGRLGYIQEVINCIKEKWNKMQDLTGPHFSSDMGVSI